MELSVYLNARRATIADGSQSWPVLGTDFKPDVRHLVSRVGSTPTGFRHHLTLSRLLLGDYNSGVNQKAALLFCVIALVGCSSSPETNGPNIQKAAAPVEPPTKPLITMNDPNAKAYFVKDVSDGADAGGWRWTFDRPELRFFLKKTEGIHAVADFSIAGDTMKTTGPVTVSFFVNDKLIGKEKYTKAGTYHFDKPVPADLLSADKATTFALEPKPIWVAPGDGKHLGLILVRAGFVS